MDRILIHHDTYHDSVFLMAISAELHKLAGLQAGHVLLATPANCQLLTREGFNHPSLATLTPTDLIIALRAERETTLKQAEERTQSLLMQTNTDHKMVADREDRVIGLEGGLTHLPKANLALISVPGEYAAYEAHKALGNGLHVMIFSDNVSLEAEIALKRRAAALGLLLMGPDCGTALIQGKPLGFVNRLRSGSIGLVGASGTGLQEVSCQIHRRGFGISHMLGTGGRDLSIEIGGISTLGAIDMLAADPNTSILVIVSKPPAPEVAQKVVEHLASLDKPSVVIFLGDKPHLAPQGKIHFAAHLSDAAWIACRLAAGEEVIPYSFMDQQNSIAPLARDMNREQRFLHGLFSGGTLGAEALLLLRERLGTIMSNLDHATKYNTENPACHTLTDLGDDEFTRGRPHPMIDPTLRAEWIVRLGQLPSTAILLLDLVLGTGCHPNPAQIVADAVHQASAKNPGLVAIASITGTELDSQDLNRQQMTLQQAGIVLCPSNIDAANFAAGLLSAKENG